VGIGDSRISRVVGVVVLGAMAAVALTGCMEVGAHGPGTSDGRLGLPSPEGRPSLGHSQDGLIESHEGAHRRSGLPPVPSTTSAPSIGTTAGEIGSSGAKPVSGGPTSRPSGADGGSGSGGGRNGGVTGGSSTGGVGGGPSASASASAPASPAPPTSAPAAPPSSAPPGASASASPAA